MRSGTHRRVIGAAVAVCAVALGLTQSPPSATAMKCHGKKNQYKLTISQTEHRTTDHSASIDFPGQVTADFSRTATYGQLEVKVRKCQSGFRSIAATGSATVGSTSTAQFAGNDTRVNSQPDAPPERRRPCSWKFETNPGAEHLAITGNLQRSRNTWNFDLSTTTDAVFASAYAASVHEAVVTQCPGRALELLSSYSDDAPAILVDGVSIRPWRPDLFGGFVISNAGDERAESPAWFNALFKGEAATISAMRSYGDIGFADGGTIELSLRFEVFAQKK